MPKQGFVCCQICTLDRCFDNHLSEPRGVDRHLARNVAWNYFTVLCQSWATSTKSSLILAASQLYLTDGNSSTSDAFSSASMLETFICVGLCSHGCAALKGFWLPAKIFRAQQIFMTSFMVRKQYVYLRTFSGNQALQNKRVRGKKETLAAGRDDLKGNLSLFWAASMRQSSVLML